jgi:hypothetical protein
MVLRTMLVAFCLGFLPACPYVRGQAPALADSAQAEEPDTIGVYDHWDTLKKGIKRLPPSAFPELPPNIARWLEANGYTIPQSYYPKKRNNLIRGHFKQSGQTDWAVLASRDSHSSIIIFWNGSEKDTTSFGDDSDNNYLYSLTDSTEGFSRYIQTATKGYILRECSMYWEEKLPPIIHEGIEDAVIERVSVGFYLYGIERVIFPRASVVFYLDKGKWLILIGQN